MRIDDIGKTTYNRQQKGERKTVIPQVLVLINRKDKKMKNTILSIINGEKKNEEMDMFEKEFEKLKTFPDNKKKVKKIKKLTKEIFDEYPIARKEDAKILHDMIIDLYFLYNNDFTVKALITTLFIGIDENAKIEEERTGAKIEAYRPKKEQFDRYYKRRIADAFIKNPQDALDAVRYANEAKGE